MDRGHSSGGSYNSGSAQNAGPQNYSYNQSQDPFNSFINTEDDAAFDNSWHSSEFSSQQQPTNNDFDQNAHAWQPPSYQQPGPSYLQIPQYNVDSAYSSSDSIFRQSAFDSTPAQDLAGRQAVSHQPYVRTSGFSPASLSNDPHYHQYSHSSDLEKTSQTISPAAITSYPDLSESSFKSNGHPSQQFSQIRGPSAHSQIAEKPALTPLSIQDWRTLSNRTVKSIDRPGLHIKPTNQFENVTQSKRFNGFIFVGNGSVAVDSSKANVPRYKRKKSRNEALKLLQLEKGDAPWHADREPLVKKLKVAAKKQGGPKSLTAGTTKGTPSATESSGSDSNESSDYTSDSDAEDEPEETFPLSATKPTDANKAIEYDLVKAIWAKRSSVLSGPVIRTALGEVWDIMKGVRDQWKKKSTLLQQAIDKKDQSTEKAFERRVSDQRKLFENCSSLILKHGHPSIIEKLGENPLMLVIFYQFLADRIKYSEYTGSFVNSILELLSHCRSVDAAMLEKTKIDKLLPRFHKRGDERGKKLTQRILDNAKVTDKKVTSDKVVNGGTSESKIPGTEVTKKETTHVVKKGAANSSAQSSAHDGVSKSSASGTTTKVASKLKREGSPEVKTKVVNVAGKPSGFFSSLKSASKKPGTSTKSEDRTAPLANKSGNVAAAPKPAFSFAATMAGLAKQKDEPSVKIEEPRKPETESERAKRLRKESRRSLRVSFKSDDQLVAIRTFEHDSDEELGHDHSQVRDVGDSKGEGQMLKAHKDLELDDEEDYEPPEEIIPLSSWTAPTLVDFSSIEEAERTKNYVSRGGLKELDASANERMLQKEREQATLMAFYASKSDIPPSPREVSDTQTTEQLADEEIFGELTDPTKSRLDEPRIQRPAQPAYVPPPATPDISALLSIINNAKQQSQPAAPAPMQPQQAVDPNNPLAAILSRLPQNIQAQPSQPQQPQQPPPPAFNLSAGLAGMLQPQQQGYQTQPAYASQAANPGLNLQAILSQIGNQTGAAPPPPPALQNYGYGTSTSTIPMHEDRKRQIEDDGNDQGRKRPRGGKPFTGAPYLPCKFWQEGKCRKGDDCTFLHESN